MLMCLPFKASLSFKVPLCMLATGPQNSFRMSLIVFMSLKFIVGSCSAATKASCNSSHSKATLMIIGAHIPRMTDTLVRKKQLNPECLEPTWLRRKHWAPLDERLESP
ncbi:unnamed protein product [Prorocentrum cordatum]|uniref:Secreted protein n=1 Tax=Prorocentrum cordatum TaxID=2364126 RepID=A0ABN9TLX7_9DINO|nr:unnamed protein product [Polarella glacialis]